MMQPDFDSKDWRKEREKRWKEWVNPYLRKFHRRNEIKYLERFYWGEAFNNKSDEYKEYWNNNRRDMSEITFYLLSPVQTTEFWKAALLWGSPDKPKLKDLSSFLGINIDHRYYGWDTETDIEWTDFLVTDHLEEEKYILFGVERYAPFKPVYVFLEEYFQPLCAWLLGTELFQCRILDGNKWAKMNYLLQRMLEMVADDLFTLEFTRTEFEDGMEEHYSILVRRRIQSLLYLSFDYENRYSRLDEEDALPLADLGDLTERKAYLKEFNAMFADKARYAALYEATSKDDYVVTG